jgi:hypothetical protein
MKIEQKRIKKAVLYRMDFFLPFVGVITNKQTKREIQFHYGYKIPRRNKDNLRAICISSL